MAKVKRDKRASYSSPPAGHKLDPKTPVETTEQLRIASTREAPAARWTQPILPQLEERTYKAGGTLNSTAQVRAAAVHEVKATPSSPRQRISGSGRRGGLLDFRCLWALR